MKKVLLIFCIAVAFASCKDEPAKKSITKDTSDKTAVEIIGKQAVLTYPDFTAEVSYLSDTTLHWKSVNSQGKAAEGDEKISYKKLNESLFFLNWIEEDGLTVSQVIDLKQKKVTSYVSFAEENSNRGKRAAIFLEGTFEFK